jgi:flagellin
MINTNIASLNAQRNLNTSQSALATSLQRLSSGLRINSAKDDAAGLAISERFTAQIRGLDQARRNANDGISLAQTAESSLESAGSALQRIRELAVQSSNASNSAADRAIIQQEVASLTSELNRLALSSEFNGQKLLDGNFGSAMFQVGANANQTIQVTSANFQTTNYGNMRMGARAATATIADGDLTIGTSATTLASSAALTTSRVAGDTITINGAAGSASVTYSAAATAKTVAALINDKTNTTGVSATAMTDVGMTGLVAATSYSMTIASDNTTAVTISFSVGATLNKDGLAAAISAFNDNTAKTGVTARANDAGTGIMLTNAAGNDITLTNAASGSASVSLGTDSAGGGTATAIATGAVGKATGQLTLDSDKSFGVTAGNTTDFFLAVTGAAQIQKVSDMDVATFGAAQRTLSIVDSALAIVNGQRAKYGAVQTRFETTINNLQATAENLSASRSRIRDTDFAQETAQLTRAQILQQAGTAMLAQANQIPNTVLTLLR